MIHEQHHCGAECVDQAHIASCPCCKHWQAALSESQAREAMMREALLRCQYGISEAIHSEDGLDGAGGQEIMKQIDVALSQSATSWLKRREAEIWRKAASTKYGGDVCSPPEYIPISIREIMLDRAAALEAEAGMEA